MAMLEPFEKGPLFSKYPSFQSLAGEGNLFGNFFSEALIRAPQNALGVLRLEKVGRGVVGEPLNESLRIFEKKKCFPLYSPLAVVEGSSERQWPSSIASDERETE